MANIIVTQTVNKVTWDVDKTSFGRAMKAVKSLKTEWEKAGKAFSASKSDPAAALKRSAMQARLVNKRLQQTERAEQAKTTAHNIAMAKKEARAREAIDKIQRARRKQAVSQLTARRSPESQADYNGLKARLRQMEKTGGGYGTNPAISAARQAALQEELARRAKSGNSSGMVGNSTMSDPSVIARQNRAMQQSVQREQAKASKEQIRAREQARKKQEAEDLRYSRYLAGKESTVANAAVRLRAKYGDNYASKLKGYDSMKERFLDSNTMKSSNFRAELAAMETGLRKANMNTLSLTDGLKNLRSTLISVTAAYGAFNAAASVVKTGQFFQGMEATMLMVSDDSAEAGKRLKFVRDQSYRLGLDLKVAAQGYTQMAIAANGVLTKSQNDELFKAFSEYSTALQVDPVKYQRGITAIQQMMGKGQIMAEELKQQLAEGIPGSLQVFIKASQEAFNDSTIDVTKMLDMMQKGELKAAKVLPFVAKYYSEAANKGGALQKALQGNRVAMQRLTLTWMDFQNKIFQSGFGESLTSAFNELAKILDSNGPLAQNLGQFFAGFTDGFMEMVYTVYNTFVLIQGIMERYIPIFRKNGEELSSAWKWVGWGMGALFFASALIRVFNILAKIAGLSGALSFLKTIFGGPDDEEGGGGDGKNKKGKGPRFSKLGKAARWLGLYGLIAGESMIAGDYVFDKAQDYSDSTYGTETTAGGNLKKNSWMGQTWDFITGQRSMTDQRRLDYLNQNGMVPGPAGAATPPMVIPTEPVSGEITIKIDAGEMKNMIDQQIEAANMGNINLILGVPQ
ncbi:tail length tape measure protein [Cronobacter phage vB_CsaM_GAP31]|uniref:Putative membrane protein n=1 Tax=Cronobacter phage vB_CsaM_GAP31 TaxID=1141135 RepID=K4F5G3_9CAUD|nr:tail length tape measure protein [Cronobacter phage vB_CsaM_GAP31]AFC21396.1 putative membrane protein [Cronobacter phage vB_CsaM_GAP31]